MIGSMRERMLIQIPGARVVSPSGSQTQDWADVATVWGRMERTGGGAGIAAGRVEPKADWRLTIRWRDDVTALCRVQWAGKTLSVVTVDNGDERRRYLTIGLKELNAR